MAEVQEFWLTQPRFLQQVGDAYPKYIHAAPDRPVKVRLPATIERAFKTKNGSGGWNQEVKTVPHPEDGFLKKVKPDAPVDNHPGKGGRKQAAQAAAVFGPQGKKPEEPKPSGVRAADQ